MGIGKEAIDVKWQDYNEHKSDHRGIEVRIEGKYEVITKKKSRYQIMNKGWLKHTSK